MTSPALCVMYVFASMGVLLKLGIGVEMFKRGSFEDKRKRFSFLGDIMLLLALGYLFLYLSEIIKWKAVDYLVELYFTITAVLVLMSIVFISKKGK